MYKKYKTGKNSYKFVKVQTVELVTTILLSLLVGIIYGLAI